MLEVFCPDLDASRPSLGDKGGPQESLDLNLADVSPAKPRPSLGDTGYMAETVSCN